MLPSSDLHRVYETMTQSLEGPGGEKNEPMKRNGTKLINYTIKMQQQSAKILFCLR